MYYDHFVLPFTIGMNILIIYLVILYWRWIAALDSSDKKKIRRGLFSMRIIKAGVEIFMESLIHRKIYKSNLVLGYMHMAFAFGWFLLIIVGKLESSFYYSDSFNPPYFAIFFRFFHPAKEAFFLHKEFAFLMDLILLYILSALSLAIIKRFKSRLLGMKRTTKLRLGDKIAMTSLWLIFPLRFFAESCTCGVNGGGSFLTHTFGALFASFLPVGYLAYPLWWAYSLSLCFFFLALPFSRYMHIPTEMMYIFLKNMGIKQGGKITSFTNFAIYSCSRCGICLDSCQLSSSLGNKDAQSVYFLQRLRNDEGISDLLDNCLACGKCENACPVGIDLTDIRMSHKKDLSKSGKQAYSYIKSQVPKTSKVVYFAGCMTHLSPNIEKSMIKIFDKAKVDYNFIDKEGGICCGRPLKLAGQLESAKTLVRKNTEAIEACEANILVTSCPICYRVFKDDYSLDMEILHHTEYLDRLISDGLIRVSKNDISYVYHDPCELSRRHALYAEPRNVLSSLGTLCESTSSKDKSLCCGGSLANTHLDAREKTIIAHDVVNELKSSCAEQIVTSCPLCKKTLAKGSDVPVLDIAEVLASCI